MEGEQFFKNACLKNVAENEIDILNMLFLSFEYQKKRSCNSILQF